MEMGESLVSAYFKYVQNIRIVARNVPFHQGQGEIDLIAIDPASHRVILCEVTTHIDGMLYGAGYDDTRDKVRDKLLRARDYAEAQFPGWKHEFQQWAPVVRPAMATRLAELEHELFQFHGMNVSMVINGRYAERVDELRRLAAQTLSATDEPAFRVLQILEHLRRD
ncbi:Holliday junction resolvase-like predicted endonuclease [Symbiobacterium terraclitae]|uniref:Holliday junction resolvase-like predicted endonuclease n=1 Tax=Symbiobacterium terraclitae TaxID=557451 RepID=A0ABS4JTF1_9FIRM|nr:YraN family protein [Symbiobacterium terraclitae]MBP2018821.1 Holliday junction resolvase-like predicted endonuclease [Symbiobacterium terraclitae]